MNNLKLIFLSLIVVVFTMPVFAGSAPLPADKAFIFSASFVHPNEILAEWQIAPGYYLYSKKIHFISKPADVMQIHFPQGEYQYDKKRGRYEAFSGRLSIPVLLKTTEPIKINIDYQGCAQDGFCYPPMRKSLLVDIATQTIAIDQNRLKSLPSLISLLSNQNEVSDFLKNHNFNFTLFIFFGLGLLLALTPCVWPMIPILATLIVGQKDQNTKKALFLSFNYVFGAALIYALAGLAAASLGSSVQVWLQQPWIIAITSMIFVLLAFSLFGYYELQLPRSWQNHIAHWNRAQQGGSYVGAFLMGAISTLIVSPCVTAPLIGVLTYIAHTGDRSEE